jgi:hypothetical protein
VLVATTIGATGFVIVDRPPDTGGGPAVERLLPPDGAAWEVVDARYGTFGVEASRFIGYAELFDLPDLVSLGIADALEGSGVDVADARFYREIWTPLGARPPAPGEIGSTDLSVSVQIIATYWLADDGIRLASLTGGIGGFVYAPPRLIVPEGVAPGSTWSSEGDALPQSLLHYRSSGSAAVGQDGCLEITTDTTLLDPAAQDAAISSALDVGIWCRGAGPLASASLVDGVESSSTTREVSGGASAFATSAAGPAPAPDASWSARPVPIVAIDPVFGESEQFVTSSPTGATTASGVSAIASGRDVVGVVVLGERAVRRFVAHPGGDIIRVSAVGDLVVVATSDRRLVAYDDSGARRWSADFGDIVPAGVLSDGAGGLLAVALDGELRRIDGADGSTLWSTSTGVDVAVTPLVTDTGIVVGGRDGRVVMLGMHDAEAVWTTSTSTPVALASLQDRVLVLTGDGTLVGFDEFDGEQVWIRTTEGANGLVTVGDVAVAHTALGLEAFDVDGERRWQLDPTTTTIGSIVRMGDAVAVSTDLGIEVLDSNGDRIVTAIAPPEFATARIALLPRADGLLLFSGDGDVLRLGPVG